MFMRGSLPEQGRRVQYLNMGAATSGRRSHVFRNYSMQLPDEAIVYQYQSLLAPALEEWTPAAELRTRNFLPASQLRDLEPRLMQVRGKIATERELKSAPPELTPLDAGFIDLPQKTLDQHRRQGEASILGKILGLSARLREEVDRVV